MTDRGSDGEELSQDWKKVRPKTAVKGKRSPKPVKTPAPWYCPKCFKENDAMTPCKYSSSTAGNLFLAA